MEKYIVFSLFLQHQNDNRQFEDLTDLIYKLVAILPTCKHAKRMPSKKLTTWTVHVQEIDRECFLYKCDHDKILVSEQIARHTAIALNQHPSYLNSNSTPQIASLSSSLEKMKTSTVSFYFRYALSIKPE